MDMKKILVIIIVTIIAIAGVIGGLAFSLSNSEVAIGETTQEDQITQSGQLNPTFSGKVVLKTDVYIYNSGVLDLENVVVTITVYFDSSTTDSATIEVGSGVNNLGTLPAKENSSRTLTVDLTEQVPRLAVEDGEFEIHIDTDLQVQNVPYTFEINKQTTEPWSAPFNPVT